MKWLILALMFVGCAKSHTTKDASTSDANPTCDPYNPDYAVDCYWREEGM